MGDNCPPNCLLAPTNLFDIFRASFAVNVPGVGYKPKKNSARSVRSILVYPHSQNGGAVRALAMVS